MSSVVLKYEVLNLTSQSTQICLQLDALNSSEQLLASTCFRATEGDETKTLTDLPIGDFVLSLVLREDLPPHAQYEDSRMTSVISVKKIEQLLPKIDMILQLENQVSSDLAPVKIIEPSTIVVASSNVGALTDLQIEYQLGQSVLPMERFDVCVRLIDINSGNVLVELSCVPSNQRTLNFREMSTGSYSLTLTLARVIDNGRVTAESQLLSDREIYESSSSTLVLHVKSLMDTDVMPVLQTAPEHRAVVAVGEEVTDVSIAFSLSGLPSIVSMVKTCAAYQLDGQTAVTEVCVAYTESVIVLRDLGPGFHPIDLYLRLANVPYTMVSEVTHRFSVDVASATLIMSETSHTGPAVVPSSLINEGNEDENKNEGEGKTERVSSNTAPSDLLREHLPGAIDTMQNDSEGVKASDSSVVDEEKDVHENRNEDEDEDAILGDLNENENENVMEESAEDLQPLSVPFSNVSSTPHASSPASVPAHRGEHSATLPSPVSVSGSEQKTASPSYFNLFAPSLLTRFDAYFHHTVSVGSTSILDDTVSARTKSVPSPSTYDEALKELSVLSALFGKVTAAMSKCARSTASRVMQAVHSYAVKTALSFSLFIDAMRRACSMRVKQCCLLCGGFLGQIGLNVTFSYSPSDLLLGFLRAYAVFLAASFSYIIYQKRGVTGPFWPMHPSSAPPP